jgi:hypothetical protein
MLIKPKLANLQKIILASYLNHLSMTRDNLGSLGEEMKGNKKRI